MEEEVFRFRSVFARETRVERASRGACDLKFWVGGGVDWWKLRKHWSVRDPNGEDELVATLKELYKNEYNLGSLDDPVLTGVSDKYSEKTGDGVVVEGSVWKAFGDEVEMTKRAEPEW